MRKATVKTDIAATTDVATAAPRKRRSRARAASPDTSTPTENAAPRALSSVPAVSEFRIDHAALRTALARITSVVDKTCTMPILTHVALRSNGSDLELVGTDLSVYLSIRVPTGAGSASFGTTVPAHKLAAIVKTLPAGEVACAPIEGALKVTAARVNARVSAIPDRDYPKIPDAPTAWSTVSAHELRNAIDATLFSVCHDDTRFHLAGALMEGDGKILTMVTTDGHRLTKYRTEWEHAIAGMPVSGILIPEKGLKELRKLLAVESTCEIAVCTRFLFVRASNATLTIKLTDAQFPPYAQVIPQGYRKLVTLESKPLVAALERAKLLTCETRGVRFSVADGTLTVVCDHPDVGDMSESMTADYQGDAFTWGVNPNYLLQLFTELDAPSVTLAFKDALDPVLVRSTHDAAMYPIGEATIIGVVMPMRV